MADPRPIKVFVRELRDMYNEIDAVKDKTLEDEMYQKALRRILDLAVIYKLEKL